MISRRISPTAPALLLLCLLLCAVSARAQGARAYTQSPLPAPTGFVNDYAGVVDAATKQRLETVLTNLKERADIEFAVVTVPTTGGEEIFEYSLKVARGWGIGSKEGEKNSLLLLVAVQDRKFFTQVSRHLEGDLPDGLVAQIGRERLREPFRQGNYSLGLSDFVMTVAATLAQKRNFEVEGIDRSKAYQPPARTTNTRRRANTSRGGLGSVACCVIIVVVFVIIALSSRGGRRGGGGGFGGGGGLLNALLLANLFSNIGRGGSGSGWGGGGGSGWGGGGGGGGGFGGFGGGGDFGGGGGGGDW